MVSIRRFIEDRLKLKVNEQKSAVDSPMKWKFLGYSFYNTRVDNTGLEFMPRALNGSRIRFGTLLTGTPA